MESETLLGARNSLERVQKFATSALPQEARLGQAYNFKEAVEPATRIIELFRQVPLEYLGSLPDNHLVQLKTRADEFYNQLDQIANFDSTQDNPNAARNQIIDGIRNRYQHYFESMHHLISYGASRQRDLSTLESEFRSALQKAKDDAEKTKLESSNSKDEIDRILADARKMAAERGVTQESIHFANESDAHESQSKTWRCWTVATAVCLVAYAAAAAFLHKWSFIAPDNAYETVQLALSKALIFIVLAYMLLLCARNFLSHKHNAIVNKHRQNALLTFMTLANAAGSDERRDVILTYAAACIFSPQETGYAKGSGPNSDMPLNIIQAIPKVSGSNTTT